MNNKRLAISEAAGTLAICAAATLLHFVYELSSGSTLAIIFGAVNESVWEHVKIFTESYCAWALLQLMWVRVPFRRYLAAKCCGLYLLMGGMIGFFYLYTGFTGRAVLWVDILSAVLLTALAQLTSYRLTTGSLRIQEFFVPALMLILLYYIMFFSFTVFPPRSELFRDPQSGTYGVGVQEFLR